MDTNFDYFGNKDKPSIFLCNPNGTRISSIGGIIHDTSLTLRFNAMSEFSFKVPKSIDGENDIPFYDSIKIKKHILIDGIGYFIITEASETSDGSTPVKEVITQSVESEMLSKKVSVLSGTFRLYNPIQMTDNVPVFEEGSSIITTVSEHNFAINQAIRFSNINVSGIISGRDYYIVYSNITEKSFSVSESPGGEPIIITNIISSGFITPSPTDSLMSYLLSLVNMNVTQNVGDLGGWKISGVLDSGLISKYRTFDVSDTNVYAFIMNEIATAYECVFIFDILNREIEIKKTDNATTNSTIFISHDNLVKSSELKEMSDEIVTALHVYGGDGIDIRGVNPTGSNILYNFDYYKNTEWMSQDLINAIDNWEAKIALQSPTYFVYVENLITYYQELAVLETELSDLEVDKATLDVIRKAAIESGGDVSTATSNLSTKENEISSKNSEISSKLLQIENTISTLSSISVLLDINNSSNFTESQRVELSKYIIENTWQNENIVIMDSYTSAQIQETKLDLYEQALLILEKVSTPRYEFSIEAINFISLQEYSKFTSQIQNRLGTEITIQGASSNPIKAVLLELSMSYDNPSDFSMTFSNRLRLNNAGFQYSDLMGQVVKTGTSVSFDKPSWSNWSNNYKENVSSFITSSLNATNNEIINSSNQEIILGEYGLRGRKSNGLGGYETNEIWLTSNVLAFTDDNWNSTKTAIGRISLGGGLYAYGLVADTIVGNLVVSENLTISNTSNSFIVNEDGAELTNAKLTIQSQLGGSGGIILDPNSTNVVAIGSISGGMISSPNFAVDTSGNVTMTGNLYSGSNYIRTDGYAKIGNLVITPTSATFSGDIYANKLIGAVSYSQLTDIPADKITSGTMSGSRISGGTMYPSAIYTGSTNASSFSTFGGGIGTSLISLTGNLNISSGNINISSSANISTPGGSGVSISKSIRTSLGYKTFTWNRGILVYVQA